MSSNSGAGIENIAACRQKCVVPVAFISAVSEYVQGLYAKWMALV
jgi:hypothetical protein